MSEPQSLRALIDLYLIRCEVEGKSPRTVTAYRDSLERFARALEAAGAPDAAAEIEPAHLYTYLAGSMHLAAETRHRFSCGDAGRCLLPAGDRYVKSV